MTDALRSLLSDPFTYLIVLATGWAAKVWLERRITSKVDAQFAKQLETHKHELSLIAETVRFEHQKRLMDANLYASKKHGAAALIYGKFREAHGLISNYNGFRVSLTFEEFNVADLAEYMTSRQVPRGMQDQILTEWHQDKDKGIAKMKKYLRMLELQEAERAFQEAKNVTYLNELYLSDSAIKAIDSLVEVLGKVLTYFQFPPERGEKVERPSTTDLDRALEVVHTAVRGELSGEVVGSSIPATLSAPAALRGETG